jgi:EmrB/QacA subfamily drug resistance transporter
VSVNKTGRVPTGETEDTRQGAPMPQADGAAPGGGPPGDMARRMNLFAPLTSDPSYKWKVLASVIFGLFMVILDSTVINVALKTLQQKYAVSTNEAQWVISLYTLALGIATPLSAFLGEKFGIKKIYVGALVTFVLGSALCGVATNASDSLLPLIVARAIQGIGGGLALPLGTAMLFGAFPPKERGVALGIFGIALVFAPASGPLLGGWLVDHDLLSWIFYLNIPIGLLGIGLASSFLRDRKSERPLRADVLGIIFSTLGFGAVLYGASRAGEQGGGGWTDSTTLIAFAVGVVALIIFSIVELRTDEPLLDLRLFKIRNFTIANLVGWVGIVGLFGAEFLLPLYLQILRGKSAFDTGLFLLPLALVSGFVTPIAGRLADRLGPRLPLVVGFGLIAFNTWQFRDIKIDTDLGWITFLLIIRGIGFGLVIQNTLVAALSDVPGRLTARATSLTNATRQTVQSIGVAILATILTGAVTINIGDEIRKNLPSTGTLPPQVQAAIQASLQKLQDSAGSGVPADLSQAPAQIRPVIEAAIQKFQDQWIAGFDHAYTATFVVAVLATLLALFLPGWPAPYTSPSEEAAKQPAGAARDRAPVPSH